MTNLPALSRTLAEHIQVQKMLLLNLETTKLPPELEPYRPASAAEGRRLIRDLEQILDILRKIEDIPTPARAMFLGEIGAML